MLSVLIGAVSQAIVFEKIADSSRNYPQMQL